ncbi:hypothetical protein V5H98_11930 [Georgenia sp. M64]|uniref:hypothetical protein n=1 Tax=Georgenia sp. M64 TaxID=3120520 RepID=UPI0030E45302
MTVQRATSPVVPGGATARNEAFLELVIEDELLLRAEFDEIVAEAWDGPHPPRERLRAGRGATRRPAAARRWRAAAAPALTLRPHGPGTDGWAHQRAPPRRTDGTSRGTENRAARRFPHAQEGRL